MPTARGNRGRDTKVSLPLLTPQPFLRTRLPSVARLKNGGPQGRLVLQEYTLDGSRAFRSANQAPCTVWPRTVMRGKPRKVTSGHNSVPKSARRTEPSPVFSRFAARPKGVAAQRRVWGSQEGAREPYGALAPSCPCRRAAASPCRRRRPMTTPSEGVKSPPAAHRCIGGKVSPLLRGKKERGRRHAAYQQVCQPGGSFFLEKCCIFPCAVHTTYSIIE